MFYCVAHSIMLGAKPKKNWKKFYAKSWNFFLYTILFLENCYFAENS